MATAKGFATLGFSIVSWIEHYLPYGPGDVQGEPAVVDDEFAAFIVKAYEVDPVTGVRAIRRSVLSRPKGRAKSLLAAWLACAEAIGPVRFDHWAVAGEVSPWGYHYVEGEPVGKPVQAPEILCFATEKNQAGNTYDGIYYMLSESTARTSLLKDYGKVDVGLTRILLPNGGSITPESAADSSKDGGKSTFVVLDETHLWVLPRLKSLHQTVIRNLLKRKVASGWCVETTTMYAPGENSVAEGTHGAAKAAAEGRVKAVGLLFDHKQAGPQFDPAKPADRLAGLQEVYGPAAGWMDLESIADSYDDPQTNSAEWERYWFNRPVVLQGAWLNHNDWDACTDRREIAAGAKVVLGFDGSFSNDSTALVAVEVGEKPHVTVFGLWEKPPGVAGWRVPILEVMDSIREACQKYNVVEVACDPNRWSMPMEVLSNEGLPMVEFGQSNGRMTPATNRFSDLVHEHGLTHDGDLRLSRHVSNTILKKDRNGSRISKEHNNSDRKIDLAVAAVMAVERASWHEANDAENDYSIHDSLLWL